MKQEKYVEVNLYCIFYFKQFNAMYMKFGSAGD